MSGQLTYEASRIAVIVAKAIRLDRDDREGVAVIEAAIEQRERAALSEIPAERVELADWLIRESGTDAPGAIDLWVAAASEGVRELGRVRGWDRRTAEEHAARLCEGFERPLRRTLALVADEEKALEW